MRISLASLLLLVACSAGPRPAAPPSPSPGAAAVPPAPAPPKLRLPDGVAPLGYELTLTLLPEQDHFDGDIAIDVDLRTRTSYLWLNGEDLDVAEAALQVGDRRVAARAQPGTGESHG